MSIDNCIIHHLQRNEPGGAVRLDCKEEEISTDGKVVSLFEQLKHRFQRTAQKRYGQFDPDHSASFPGLIADYLEGRSDFIKLTRTAMNTLEQSLCSSDEPFDAHVLLLLEDTPAQKQLYIFWINHVSAYQIGADKRIHTSHYIDTAKLGFVLKLKCDDWQADRSTRYLSLYTPRGNRDLTHAFLQFSNFISSADPAAETREFLHIADQFAAGLPDENVRDFKQTLIDYCIDQDRRGNPVVVEELSAEIDEQNPSRFAHYVSENQAEPLAEIQTHRQSLKRYVRFWGRDKNLSISFNADMFGHEIQYHAQENQLVIDYLPKALKLQLADYHARSLDTQHEEHHSD